MNWTQLLGILEELGLSGLQAAITPLVKIAQIENPTATPQQIVAIVDGQLKHQAREKINGVVDFIWWYVSPLLDQEILTVASTVVASGPTNAAPALNAVYVPTPPSSTTVP